MLLSCGLALMRPELKGKAYWNTNFNNRISCIRLGPPHLLIRIAAIASSLSHCSWDPSPPFCFAFPKPSPARLQEWPSWNQLWCHSLLTLSQGVSVTDRIKSGFVSSSITSAPFFHSDTAGNSLHVSYLPHDVASAWYAPPSWEPCSEYLTTRAARAFD